MGDVDLTTDQGTEPHARKDVSRENEAAVPHQLEHVWAHHGRHITLIPKRLQ